MNNSKVLALIYLILFVLVLVSVKYFDEHPLDLCLVSNEINKDTGFHTIVKVREERDDYYVTGDIWDNSNQEWYGAYPRLLEKRLSIDYVTEMRCPSK